MKKLVIYLSFFLFSVSCGTSSPDQRLSSEKSPDSPLNRAGLPQPVYDANPGYVDLYWEAWESAWRHVKFDDGAIRSPFMDEACWDGTLWIWDSCFMTLFTKYANRDFPGIENLDNLYGVFYEGAQASQRIHIPDNPPLFAWVEWEHFKKSGDLARVRQLLLEKKYLQRHYEFIKNARTGDRFEGVDEPIRLNWGKLGSSWTGGASGMDNTPRGQHSGGYSSIYWIDIISQQALSALYISRLFDAIEQPEPSKFYMQEYEKLKKLINNYYWDSEDGFYYDIQKKKPYAKDKTMTPASFWAMLAEIPTPEQAEQMAQKVKNPDQLGGFVNFPTVARDDPSFHHATGDYWLGGVWLPTTYMSIKALGKYGFLQLADESALKMVEQQYLTWKNYSPSTIWECYNPSKNEPSTEYTRVARPDFCGWSALGPISLFVENIIGIRVIDAIANQVIWDTSSEFRHGVKNLTMGEINFSLITDSKILEVESTGDFVLMFNGRRVEIKAGVQRINL
ncbi:MAG: hypothetical protein JXR63_01745 [Spirochaetales bacterium]|nr:hypothetical protein [Spirochaetales bacterium]